MFYTSVIYSFSLCISAGPGPPGKFVGIVLSDSEIFITWEEPVNANGIIRSYHLRAYETKTWGEVYNRNVTKGPKKEESLKVSKLRPYTNFNFTIQARTIELGEMAYFTAKTQEGGKFKLYLCEPLYPPPPFYSLVILFYSCDFPRPRPKTNVLFLVVTYI